MRVRVPYVGEQEVYAGDDWSLTVRVNTKVGTSLIPEDLEDWTGWEAEWRPHDRSDVFVPLVVQINLPNEITLRAGSLATMSICLAAGEGIFDAQATRDGQVRTFFRGSTKNVMDVTR